MTANSQGLIEARDGTYDVFRFEWQFRGSLSELWQPDTENTEEPEASSYSMELPRVVFSHVEPEALPWSIAFTPTFKKAIATADKKVQGRVLSALSELSETPTVLRGDTRKPLSGEFKGLWRYRFGDYRLVYEPRETARVVVLLDFGARGGIYEA
jgi:addiction module RelE/StbE family toxin